LERKNISSNPPLPFYSNPPPSQREGGGEEGDGE